MKYNNTPIIHTVFFFPNGNTAVCKDGQQVPELQQSWLKLFVKSLEEQGVDALGCEFKLPNDMTARVFKCEDGSYNWEVE